jgi:hypothetical protein
MTSEELLNEAVELAERQINALHLVPLYDRKMDALQVIGLNRIANALEDIAVSLRKEQTPDAEKDELQDCSG